MHRLISTILALLVSTLCFAQNNREHEWRIAMDFLESRGISPESLTRRLSMKTLVAFADIKSRVYAYVVKQEYEQYLDNPIIAYGIDERWPVSSLYIDNELLEKYDSLIVLFKEYRLKYQSPRNSSQGRVEPLLGRIKLGQGSPYNKYFPVMQFDGGPKTCIAGCGPVALSEVLAYHRSSTPPTGKVTLKTEAGTEYKLDLSTYSFTWDESADELARLMLCSAASLEATVAPDGSSSGMAIIKPVLLRNWHYSPRCTYKQKDGDLEMISTITSELNHRRPVLLADNTHMYVCDGYDRDYLHLNFGWDGYSNGYYRTFVTEIGHSSLLPFKEILYGIEPMAESDFLELDVHVEHAGQLAQKLSQEQLYNVTKLRVTGEINGDDIAVIRQMAGALPYPDNGTGHGSLMDLDLSGARIVKGGCYVTRSANSMTFSGYTYSGGKKVFYNYDMSKLKAEQWNRMKSIGLIQKPARTIKSIGKGQYVVSWYSLDSTIGQYMFDGCDNLLRIVLPRNLKEVKENAFFGCISLVKVEGLPQNTSAKAFNNTKIQWQK